MLDNHKVIPKNFPLAEETKEWFNIWFKNEVEVWKNDADHGEVESYIIEEVAYEAKNLTKYVLNYYKSLFDELMKKSDDWVMNQMKEFIADNKEKLMEAKTVKIKEEIEKALFKTTNICTKTMEQMLKTMWRDRDRTKYKALPFKEKQYESEMKDYAKSMMKEDEDWRKQCYKWKRTYPCCDPLRIKEGCYMHCRIECEIYFAVVFIVLSLFAILDLASIKPFKVTDSVGHVLHPLSIVFSICLLGAATLMIGCRCCKRHCCRRFCCCFCDCIETDTDGHKTADETKGVDPKCCESYVHEKSTESKLWFDKFIVNPDAVSTLGSNYLFPNYYPDERSYMIYDDMVAEYEESIKNSYQPSALTQSYDPTDDFKITNEMLIIFTIMYSLMKFGRFVYSCYIKNCDINSEASNPINLTQKSKTARKNKIKFIH